jgi:hypothetical protein
VVVDARGCVRGQAEAFLRLRVRGRRGGVSRKVKERIGGPWGRGRR